MVYPLPKNLIREFARVVKTLLIVEELDPFLEEQIKAMGLTARGKDVFPVCGELLPEDIELHSRRAGLLPPAAQAAPAGVPEGIEIVSVADRPELWREAYDPLALQAFADMALDRPLLATLEQGRTVLRRGGVARRRREEG